MNTMVDVIM